jgi:hypothetical protein
MSPEGKQKSTRLRNTTINIEVSTVGDRLQFGQGSVGTTKQKLGISPTTEPLKRGVTIKAITGNANVVYVGGPELASNNGYPLIAGESLFIAAASIEQVWVLGGAAAQNYAWVGI